MFKAANNLDVYDPENGNIIMECRKESLGMFTKMQRVGVCLSNPT